LEKSGHPEKALRHCRTVCFSANAWPWVYSRQTVSNVALKPGTSDCHEGSNKCFLSLVVDEERMMPLDGFPHWGSLLRVFFNALTLLVG